MYELIQVSDRCYYIHGPTKIGLLPYTNAEICLIDSGNNKDAGKRILRILNEREWKLRSICNTHSHADHIGGNRYLQNQTGCTIYAPGVEAAMTKHPVLEPAFLYGGYPGSPLRHKFLLAEESDAHPLVEEVLPEGTSILSLPGHCFDMVGLRTAEDIVFLGDCLSSVETLEKYQVSFLYDVAAYLQTLEMVESLSAALFIPTHADVTENIAPLARYNIQKVMEVAEQILSICSEPTPFETILQKIFAYYNLTMNFEQYVLVGSTVRSYLSWLLDTGKLQVNFENNLLLWERV